MRRIFGHSGPCGAGYRVQQHDLEHRQSSSVFIQMVRSNEHKAEHGAESEF